MSLLLIPSHHPSNNKEEEEEKREVEIPAVTSSVAALENLSLRDETEQLYKQSVCLVCFKWNRSLVTLPCSHFTVCDICMLLKDFASCCVASSTQDLQTLEERRYCSFPLIILQIVLKCLLLYIHLVPGQAQFRFAVKLGFPKNIVRRVLRKNKFTTAINLVNYLNKNLEMLEADEELEKEENDKKVKDWRSSKQRRRRKITKKKKKK